MSKIDIALPISLMFVLIFLIGIIVGASIYKAGYFDGLWVHKEYSEWQFERNYQVPIIDDRTDNIVVWRRKEERK